MSRWKKWWRSRRSRRRVFVSVLLFSLFLFLFPDQLFHDPHSTILLDTEGKLLSAKIADDGQWRFPEADSVPHKLEQAILHFEDEYFHWHPGVNPVSIGRALWQNLTTGKVVSGGSTLTMQVIRMSRGNPPRTYWEKLIELYLAMRMEFTYSKDEILRLYVSHAPYGGNVVGVEAASWRYFNRPLNQLSWAETATLAVLPNSPALIHPGRNRDALRAKRDRLLKKLTDNQVIDTTAYSLSLMEGLPEQPNTLPTHAFHLLDFAVRSGMRGQRIQTTVDGSLQRSLTNKVHRYIKLLSENDVHNACAMVVSLETGEVKAYVGNATIPEARSPFVDIIHAPRSSGSILKPFLYAGAVAEGRIHTRSLLRDVPTTIGRYTPQNFDRRFEGVVPASEALARSLNIPATLLLRHYGIPIFYEDLQKLGMHSINRSVGNYGLTLILGGAEVTLWDLVEAYAEQAMALRRSTQMTVSDSGGIKLWSDRGRFHGADAVYDPAAWWMISEALTDVQRPGLNKDWRRFSSSRKIAWKTGTSHGFRDAWAIGFDGTHLVAVWVGNADGEGRPGLTGTSVASPLMFEAFQTLPRGEWFFKPEGSLKNTELCSTSGMAPSPSCPRAIHEVPIDAKTPQMCTVHEPILINDQGQRVYRDCARGDVRDTVWFSLDPIAAHFYESRHSTYRSMPSLAADCQRATSNASIAIVYPTPGLELIMPRNFQGDFEHVQFKAAHTHRGTTLFWHLDEQFIGTTNGSHQLTLDVKVGSHTLLVMDEQGNKATCRFRLFRG